MICARAPAKPGRTMCPACAAKAAARTREDTAAKRKDWEELSQRVLQLEEENAELKKLLARSGDCTGCVYDNTCDSTDFICDECPRDCICKRCKNNSEWKWKGRTGNTAE